MRGTRGRIRQDEYFDRIVRDNDELLEKLRYMSYNPVERGLAEDPSQYDGWYMKEVTDKNVCPTNTGGETTNQGRGLTNTGAEPTNQGEVPT